MSSPAREFAPAVEARGVHRTFRASRGGGEVVALAGVDVRIERGEVFGLLGPNGAGKTTFIKILSTLLFPTTGEARVAGHDVVREAVEVRRRISLVSGGESAGYGILTVRECLWMFSQYYGVPSSVAWPRVDRLIEVVGMGEQQHTRINRLSTGQRQRMNFARGFVSDPEVLFLDEPTLGMDVTAARTLRGFVASWVRERPERTVLLTTHYMAEADELCDRVAIIDRGRVLACDSTAALRRQVQGGQHVELEIRSGLGPEPDLAALTGIPAVWGAPHPERGTRTLKFRLPPELALVDVLRRLESQAVRVEGIATRETTLEDVFIAVVGRGFEDWVRPRDATRRAMSGNARGLSLNLRAAYARCYVRLVGSIREPAWIVGDAVFPALGMAAFVLLYRALGAPRSLEAVAVIGGVLSSFWINVLWGMGAQLYWEKQQGQLQLYFAAPCSRIAILAGMAVGGIAMTSVRAVFGIALGFGVFGVRVEPFQIGALLGVFAVTMVALYALGMVLASLFLLYGREAWHLCNALTEPVYFLSGMYFPLRTLGALGSVMAGILPLALGIDAMRQVLLGAGARGLLPLGTEVAILAGLGIVLCGLARFSLAYLESLSKREGRLTQRWQ